MLMVSDAINRLGIFERELTSNMPAISKEVGGLFLNAKINQIRRIGIGSYSAKKFSPSFLKGKELNGAGTSFIAQKTQAKQKTNWAEFRVAQGLQSQFVDVYYSGQMLNSTAIIRANSASFRYYVTIGGRNQESKDKLSYNRKRYGHFLYPLPEQTKLMGKRSMLLIGNIYKRVLLT